MELKIKVPSDQSEIRLEQYQKFLDIVDLNKDDDNAQEFLSLKMLEIFCGVPFQTSLKYKYKDVHHIAGLLGDVIESKEEFVQKFKLGDTEFGFIPKLDDMTFGEYVDLESNMGDWKNMHKAMAVLYRPIKVKYGERYRLEEYKGDNYHEAMKQMPLSAVLGAIVFFYNLGKDLSEGMRRYLEMEEVRIIQGKDNLMQSGDGITQFTHSLKGMLQSMNVFLN